MTVIIISDLSTEVSSVDAIPSRIHLPSEQLMIADRNSSMVNDAFHTLAYLRLLVSHQMNDRSIIDPMTYVVKCVSVYTKNSSGGY